MALDETVISNQAGHIADHAILKAAYVARGETQGPLATYTSSSTKAEHLGIHNKLHVEHTALGGSLPNNPTSGHLSHHNALHKADNRRANLGIAMAYNRLSGASQATIDLRMSQIAATGAQWFRMDFPAYELEPASGTTNWAQPDKIINSAYDHGLKVLFLANTAPAWVASAWNDGPTTSAERNAYADYCARAVQRYAGKIHAIELWNEPNLSGFWTPAPNVTDYGNLISVAYPAIKAVSSIPVLAAGTGWSFGAPNIAQDTWYSGLYSGGFKNYFDAVNVHPYQDTYQCSIGSHFSFGNIGNVTNVRTTMNDNGDSAKQIWGTEWGFTTFYTTEAQSADWLPIFADGWFDQGTGRGATGPLFRYTLIDTDSSTSEGQFGLLRTDGSQKPAWGEFIKLGAYASGSGSVEPPVATGLRLWFDASQIPGLSDGNAVIQWNDASGNSNHAAQGTVGSRPTYRTNVVNGKPVVRFDGGDELAITNADAAALTNNQDGLTIFTVASLSAADGAVRDLIFFSTNTAAGTTRLKMGQRSGPVWAVSGRRLDADTLQHVTGSTATTGFQQLTAAVNWSSSDATLYHNGVSVGSSTSFQTDGLSQAANSLGVAVGNASTLSEYWQGDIAEILVYDSVLSTSDRQSVEAYLNAKYGLGASGSPYWEADFESGPSNGVDKYSGYEDWSFVQAEEPDQANPALSGVVLASTYGFAAHSGVCVGMFKTDHTAWLANLYHSKVYKQFQFTGSTTVVDVHGNNLQAAPSNSINGTYRAWYYVPTSGFDWYTTGSNIFQFKLDEQDPFRQEPQWWVSFQAVNNDLAQGLQIKVNSYSQGGSYVNPGGLKTITRGQWFEIRADVYEGSKIDWYFGGAFWQTSLASSSAIGRAAALYTPRSWVFGVGHYGEGGPLFIDDASFTPF
jgi:hypothetical protein